MRIDLARVEAIFNEAMEISDSAERAALLAKACGSDAELRRRVDALLAAHDSPDNHLKLPDFGANADPYVRISEGPGATIGRYKLLEQIGEGGFGIVFMAEQESPVRRRVALKIIKLGMDTKQVVARFEAERQALAMMDHPNVAKVLDAAATETGRSYFVMELVKGIEITRFCNERKLSTRQRLDLFISVCRAVEHAHQKGIIHRDIKPSNVLVTLQDDKPVPKVIDFGIAKATQSKLTEQTLFTGFHQMIGTPAYMSPEQAQMGGLDIDTRSDIYSLGVLLYELLTGMTPFDAMELRSAAYAEMQRIIREVEPPQPSARWSALSLDTRTTFAGQRQSDPHQVTHLLRGDLDWITMRCLEKNRGRRYETATSLVADIQRYLHDEAVEACPPSARYLLSKYVRRNKRALSIAAIVLFFLTLLGGGVAWTMHDRSTRRARTSGQLELILQEVARLEEAQKWPEALVSARRAEPALATDEALTNIQERVRQALGDLELVQRLEDIRAQSGTAWASGNSAELSRTPIFKALTDRAEQDYASAFREAGIDVDELPAKETARKISARGRIADAVLPAMDDWVAVRSRVRDKAATQRLIDVLRTADLDPWRRQMREAFARDDLHALETLAGSPDLDRQPVATFSFLAAALRNNGNFPREIDVLRRAQSRYPADYWINHRLGVSLIWRGSPNDVREGIGYVRAAVALRPESDHSMLNLGNGYCLLGETDEAIVCYRKAIELKLARSNTGPCDAYLGLGSSLQDKGLHQEAIAAFEQAIKSAPGYAITYAFLAMTLSNCPEARLRDPRRALELATKAIEIEPQASNNWTALGIAHYRLGQWQQGRIALEKSLQLGTDSWGGSPRWPDAIDWFFLTMCNWRLGHQDQARQCYDRGTQWIEKAKPWQTDEEELQRARTEAEKLLKISGANSTTKASPDAR